VLVGLEDGDQRSPDGHRGAVEGVHKLRAALGAGAAIETPRLEVGAVRARGDFTEAGLAGHPGLTVELAGRRCAEVADGDVLHAVMQAERAQDLLLDTQDPEVFGGRTLGVGERKHLDLVELVHAENPRVSRPAAPASRRKQVEMPA